MGGEAGARQKKRRKRKQQEKKGAQRRANAPPPPAPAASPSDVAAWVLEVLPAGAALNAEPAAERLVSEAVDGATLRELDAADLRDIGFSRVQAKKLLAALRREQDETRDAGDPADSSHSDGGGSISQVPLHAIPVATAPPQLVVPPTYDHEDCASAEHDEAEWYAIPMQRWGEREALAWVSTLGPRSGGGQNVRAAFARENIDGPLLVALGQDDADDLGLSFREAKLLLMRRDELIGRDDDHPGKQHPVLQKLSTQKIDKKKARMELIERTCIRSCIHAVVWHLWREVCRMAFRQIRF